MIAVGGGTSDDDDTKIPGSFNDGSLKSKNGPFHYATPVQQVAVMH